MTVKQNIDAKALGKRFAQLVRERDLSVQSVWVRDTGEVPEIWIITEPMELEQMRPVYEARIALRRSFPAADYAFNTINPDWIHPFRRQITFPQTAIEYGWMSEPTRCTAFSRRRPQSDHRQKVTDRLRFRRRSRS